MRRATIVAAVTAIVAAMSSGRRVPRRVSAE